MKIDNKFMLSSYVNFYDIFVWQMASKKVHMEFVTKILMQNCKERLVIEISKIKEKQTIYHIKKGKEPDHLFNLVRKTQMKQISIDA